MSLNHRIAALAFVSAIAAPATAWGMGIGIGCANLPVYNRAIGTLQGISSCGFTVDQARRIIAERDGPAAVYQEVAPPPRAYHRHQK